MAGIGIFLDQLAIRIHGLGEAIGKEVAFRLEEHRIFLQGGIWLAVGGFSKKFAGLVVLLVLVLGVAFLEQFASDQLIGTQADGLFRGFPQVFRRELFPC